MNNSAALKTELHETEQRLLAELRTLRRGMRTSRALHEPQLTVGQRIADWVAATMGSWRFIIIQSIILLIWIVLNVTAYIQQWDPYPFILLNLALSFQAAYAAPFIMMSQNRQQDVDRKTGRERFSDQRQGRTRDRTAASEDRPAARDRSREPDRGGQGARRHAAQELARRGPRRVVSEYNCGNSLRLRLLQALAQNRNAA